MQDEVISVDEYLSTQKGAVKGSGTVLKSFKSPSSWDDETRSCIFTVSAEVEDRDRDIIDQAGLDFKDFMNNPTALMFHSGRSWPVGKWSDITPKLTGRPKRTEGKLTLLPAGVEPDADRAAAHIQHGTIKTVSIGFLPKEVVRRAVPEDKRNEYYYPGYHIKAAEIIEISLVSVPSLRQALAKDTGDGIAMSRDVIAEFLDGFCKMPNGLIVPVEQVVLWEQAYLEKSGNQKSVVVKTIDAEAVTSDPVVTVGSDPVVTAKSEEKSEDAAEGGQEAEVETLITRALKRFGIIKEAPKAPEKPTELARQKAIALAATTEKTARDLLKA